MQAQAKKISPPILEGLESYPIQFVRRPGDLKLFLTRLIDDCMKNGHPIEEAMLEFSSTVMLFNLEKEGLQLLQGLQPKVKALAQVQHFQVLFRCRLGLFEEVEQIVKSDDVLWEQLNLATIFLYRGEHEQALAAVLGELPKTDSVVLSSLFYLRAATALQSAHVGTRARHFFEMAAEGFSRLNAGFYSSMCDEHLGSLASMLGDPTLAISFFEKRVQFLQQARNRSQLAPVMNNLGQNYESVGRFQEAAGYYKQAFELASPVHRAMIAVNLSQAERKLGNLHEAIGVAKMGLLHCAKGSSEHTLLCLEIAYASFLAGDLEKARLTLERVQFLKLETNEDRAEYLILKGEILLDAGSAKDEVLYGVIRQANQLQVSLEDWLKARIDRMTGRWLAQTGKRQEASEKLRGSLLLLKRESEFFEAGWTCMTLAQVEKSPEWYREAAEQFRKAQTLHWERLAIQEFAEALDERSPALALNSEDPVELPIGSLKDMVADFEARVIRKVLNASGGNRRETAHLLNVSEKTIQRRINQQTRQG